MDSFTISQLQQYSGISVHSIRAWEKRYDALKPDRSEGNTRYYNGNQLRRLLNIASLMHSEYKISELCSMTDSELYALMNEQLEAHKAGDELLVSQMVAAAMEFNEALFNKIFAKAKSKLGIDGAYSKVIYPSLQRIGVMWSADGIAPAQEHFISQLIRQKLNASIDALPLNEKSKQHWILFLPENEFHETGLLMANYLVRSAGHQSTYLGSNVPMESLHQAVKQLKSSSLLSFLVAKDDEAADMQFIQSLVKTFPGQKIYVAGEADRMSKLISLKKFTPLTSMDAFQHVLGLSTTTIKK